MAVLLVAGILLTVAAPRFFSATAFSARGFADQTAAMLRYAQKLAIARHGSVYVQADGDTLSLCLDVTKPCPTSRAVSGPDGSRPYRVSAPTGVGIALRGGDFAFDALGRPSGGRQLVIAGDVDITLVVEAETGYVH